ncbi:MAG: hypothetical protein U0793_20010 [Gemmataceae bacterium]
MARRFMDYHVLLANPYLHEHILPAQTEGLVEGYSHGLNSLPESRSLDVPVAVVIHEACATRARALIPPLPQPVTEHDGTKREVMLLPGEAICSMTAAMIRFGARLLRSHGVYSATYAHVSIQCRNLPQVFMPNPFNADLVKHMPGRRLLGPALPAIDEVTTLPWPNRESLMEFETHLAHRYVSSFGVLDQQIVDAITSRARSQVRTVL